MEKIMKCVLVALFIFTIGQTALLSAEEAKEYGLNQNQPLSLGDWIYKSYFAVMAPNAPKKDFTILYKGIEDQNIIIESRFEDTKVFKIPVDSNNQAFLNKADYKSTLLLTIVDEQNRITVEEIEYKREIPIRFYPDLKKAVFHKTDDFEDDTGIISAIEDEIGPFEESQND